jgi:Tfp pilus assembly protein PilO
MKIRPFIPLIIALLVLLAVGGLYGFAYQQLEAGKEKAATLALQLDGRTVEFARLTQARAALASLASDEEALHQYSIRKESIVPFLEQIQSVGKPLGATVDVISVGDEKNPIHARVALSLTISGSFDAVMRTLGAIEYAPYDAVVTNASLDTIEGSKLWTAAVTYSVGVATSTPAKP